MSSVLASLVRDIRRSGGHSSASLRAIYPTTRLLRHGQVFVWFHVCLMYLASAGSIKAIRASGGHTKHSHMFFNAYLVLCGSKSLSKHLHPVLCSEQIATICAVLRPGHVFQKCLVAECVAAEQVAEYDQIFASLFCCAFQGCLAVSLTYMPIVLKLVLINFMKHTSADLTCIFVSKLAITLRCFNVFDFFNINTNHDVAAILKLCNHIMLLDCTLKDITVFITQVE